jgi:hydroxyacid-oxoacid transhydrogenase
MGVDTSGLEAKDAGDAIAERFIELMKATGIPNGLRAVGYGNSDIDEMVQGTLPQHRVTKLSPRLASAEDLRKLFAESMTLW